MIALVSDITIRKDGKMQLSHGKDSHFEHRIVVFGTIELPIKISKWWLKQYHEQPLQTELAGAIVRMFPDKSLSHEEIIDDDANLSWYLHSLFEYVFHDEGSADGVKNTRRTIVALLDSVRKRGLMQTIFSKFEWCGRERPVDVKKLRYICNLLHEPILSDQLQALMTWNKYMTIWKYDTALPEWFFDDCKGGLSCLLHFSFFKRQDCKDENGVNVVYYKTPEVIRNEEVLIKSLQELA